MARVTNGILNKSLVGGLLALAASGAYSGTMGPEAVAGSRAYIGVFGGGGAITDTDIGQFGTAFFSPVNSIGTVAVNAFGKAGGSSVGVVGGHVGMSLPSTAGSIWSVTPAVEVEGYYIGGAELEGHEIDSNAAQLSEHDFLVNYNLKSGVFLVNAVLNGNNSMFQRFKPYIGVGVGSAVVSVSDANALQTTPLELGLNHFSTTNDRAAALALQPKAGFRFEVNATTSVYAEYRFLYVAPVDFTFASTVSAGHVATSAWSINMDAQYYNMGTVGVDFDL